LIQDEWSGTATELCNEMKKQDGSFDLNPATLTKRIKAISGLFRKEFNIAVDFERNRNSRRIILKRADAEATDNEGVTV